MGGDLSLSQSPLGCLFNFLPPSPDLLSGGSLESETQEPVFLIRLLSPCTLHIQFRMFLTFQPRNSLEPHLINEETASDTLGDLLTVLELSKQQMMQDYILQA